MAITAHAPALPYAQPLANHPVVSTSTLPLSAQLLIAQAVAQLGTADWKAVENKIEHSREWPEGEAGRLTSQGYHEAFKGLMHERGLDSSACAAPLSRPSRKLVHSLYSTLLNNLRADILTNLSEEARLNSELASIRAAAAAAQQQYQQQTASTSSSASAPPSGSSDSKKRPRSREGKGRPAAVAPQQQQQDEDAEMASPSASTAAVAAAEDSASASEAKKPSSGSGSGRRKSGRKVVSSVYVEEDSDNSADEEEEEAASASATPAPSAVEGTPAPAVKAEEEEEEAVPPGREGEQGEVGEEEEGDGEEEEEEEEEEVATRKSTRARKGSRKSRTAAATAAKKAQQARKRKQSEPLSTIGEDSVEGEGGDGETVADTPLPPAAAEASAPPSASSKRGGGRKRVKTEELGDEDKDAKLALQRRKSAYTRLITQLQSERYSHFFETRVTRSIAPKYNIAVLRPTCLKDILKKIKAGDVRDETELMREVGLLCANAMQFNGDEGEESVGHCARLMWERFERLVEEYMSTELAAGEL